MKTMKRMLTAIVLTACVTATAMATEKEVFGGLGLSVTQIYDQESETHLGDLVVLDVLKDTDAQKQGIEKGDIITHVDGRMVAGKNFQELIYKHLRGKPGSESVLTIKRAGEEKPLIKTVTRIKIVYPGK